MKSLIAFLSISLFAIASMKSVASNPHYCVDDGVSKSYVLECPMSSDIVAVISFNEIPRPAESLILKSASGFDYAVVVSNNYNLDYRRWPPSNDERLCYNPQLDLRWIWYYSINKLC